MADKEAREPEHQDRGESQPQDGAPRQPDGQAPQQPDEETLDQAVVLGADQYDPSSIKQSPPESFGEQALEEDLDPSQVLDRDPYDQNAIRHDGIQRPGEPEPEEALGHTAALNRDQYSQSDINQPATETASTMARRSEPISRSSGNQKPDTETAYARMPTVDRTEESVLVVEEPSVRVVIGEHGGPAPVRRVEGKEPPAEETTAPETAARVNQAPVANADRGQGRADSQFEIDVLANDTDGNPDDTPITFTLDQVQVVGNTGPAGAGQVTIADNQLVFTPGTDFDALAEGETATVTVRYQMSDDEGASASSTATVIVTGVNAAPDAADDTLLVQEGGSHTFTVADFGFRDTDTSDTLQSVTITRLPAAGSLTLNNAAVTAGQVITASELATLTFTPATHAHGDGYADLQFTVSDGRADSPLRTLTIDVGEVNDAPTAQDKTLSIAEDGSHTFVAGDFGFNDVDTGDTLHSVTITRLPSAGSLTLNDTPVMLNQVITAANIGNLKFSPAAQASGNSYTDLQFIVSDGDLGSSEQALTFNVTPVTDAPTITLNNEVYSDLALDTELITNGSFDTSADGWSLTGTVDFGGVGQLSFSEGNGPNDGVAEQNFSIHPDVSYTLSLDYATSGFSIVQSGLVEVIDVTTGNVLASETITTSSGTNQAMTLSFAGISAGNATLRITDTSTQTSSIDLRIDNISIQATSADNGHIPTGVGVFGQEDQAIAVDLDVATPDSDGSETLAIELTGIPADVVLTDGSNTLTSTGEALDVSGWNLGSLSVTSEQGIDFTMTVTATATETAIGATAVTSQAINVHVQRDEDPDIDGELNIVAPDDLVTHTVTEAFLLSNASDAQGDSLSVQDVSIDGVSAHRHDFQTSFSAGSDGSAAVNGDTLTLTSGAEENVVLIDTTGGGIRGTDLHLDFTVAPTDGHATRNNFIVFDYVDENNYKTIGSYDGDGSPEWCVEQWSNGTNTSLCSFDESSANSNINTDRHYEVDIVDNRVSLTVDGVEKVAHQFSENISDGELGVMNRGNSVSTYTLNGADWDITPDNQHAVYDNNDGTWTILPGDNLAGDLTLDYTVSDGELTTAATAVIPVERSPDASIELSDTTGISDDVLPVETTAGGDLLTVTSVNGQAVAATGTTSIDGEFGTLGIAADGSWSYNLDSAYASADLTSDLIARWTFDEASGTTVADSSTVDSIADNGTLNGATFVSDGISGSAVAFDGSNDRIDVANSTELNTYTGTKSAQTISLAFKLDPANDLTGTQILYEQGGGANGFNIYIRDGNLYVGAWSLGSGWDGAYVSASLAGLDAGWHSVSLVLDATRSTASERTLTGYLDGNDFGSETAEAVNQHAGAIAFGGMRQDTKIDTGALSGDGNYFQGEIDEARIYNRALSDSEVRVLGQFDKSETFTYDVSDGTNTSTATLAIDVQHTLDSTGGISGTVGDETLTGTAFGEQIDGLAGVDTLMGNGGDDWLVGGAGNDTMTGGAGSDTFVWIAGHEGTASSVAIDTITDFNATAGGDAIDLSLLLAGETETTLDQYLNVNVTGGNTEIEVKPAGAGGDVTQKIVLEGVDLSGLGDNTAILNTLLQNGNLHIDG